MKSKGFVYHHSWFEAILKLPRQERERMAFATLNHLFGVDQFSYVCDTELYQRIAKEIDEEKIRHTMICLKRQAIGKRGGDTRVANAKPNATPQPIGQPNGSVNQLVQPIGSIYNYNKDNNIELVNNKEQHISNIISKELQSHCNDVISIDILLSNIYNYNITCKYIDARLIRQLREENNVRYKGLVIFYDIMQRAYEMEDNALRTAQPLGDNVKFLLGIEVDMLRYIAMRFNNEPIQSDQFIHQLFKDALTMSGGDIAKASNLIARATANRQNSFRNGRTKQHCVNASNSSFIDDKFSVTL